MIFDSWWKIALIILGLVSLRVAVPYLSRASTSFRSGMVEALDTFLIALALVLLIIRPFIVQAFYIPSKSMIPTLQERDIILVSKFAYRFHKPRRGDIIVFRAPPEALASNGETSNGETSNGKMDYVKRVVAVAGDHVRIELSKTYINGKLAKEPYVKELANYRWPEDACEGDKLYKPPGKACEEGEYTVPPGSLFVFGDNRANSNDSKSWGPLSMKDENGRYVIQGKAIFRFWPPSRIGVLH